MQALSFVCRPKGIFATYNPTAKSPRRLLLPSPLPIAIGLNSLTLDYGATFNQSLASSAMIAKTVTIGSGQAQASTYNQSGGSNTTGPLYVGYQGAGSGVYNLSGGALNVGTTGTFNQSAGTTTVMGQCRAGYDPGAAGTVTLKGGSFNVSGQTTMGSFGTGSFTQSGGSATLGGLVLSNTGHNENRGSWNLLAGRQLELSGTNLDNNGFAMNNAVNGTITGNSNTTFYGAADFQSGSEPRVSSGAIATFFQLVPPRAAGSSLSLDEEVRAAARCG